MIKKLLLKGHFYKGNVPESILWKRKCSWKYTLRKKMLLKVYSDKENAPESILWERNEEWLHKRQGLQTGAFSPVGTQEYPEGWWFLKINSGWRDYTLIRFRCHNIETAWRGLDECAKSRRCRAEGGWVGVIIWL